MTRYDHRKIEEKWQKRWEEQGLYKVNDNSKKPKYYQLETFPYPSAAGLHVGHPKGYIAEDIHARFMRAQGKEVLYTMGWDAFGLPTENYAIKIGKSPKEVAEANVKNFKRQVKMFGLSYDWDREINTSSPEYYKWTQWLFLQLYKAGLAYRKMAKVNWCPQDQTVLADEQVIAGACERCGTQVIQKDMEQWFFKITDYAERLLSDLEGLDWPTMTKEQQRNWIGRKEGINITYEIETKNNYVILHGWNSDSQDPKYAAIKREIEKTGAACFLPDLPNTKKPFEDEQVDFVLKHTKFDKNTILYGKSLGGVVAMKVLEKLKEPIAGLVLAGSFISPKGLKNEYPFANTFNWEFDFAKIKKNAGFIKILSDLKDHAVNTEQGKILEEKLRGELIETVAMQSHFGAEFEPAVIDALLPRVTVFTTRPDTNFGATFVVIGPEHPLLNGNNPLNIAKEHWEEIKKYQKKIAAETQIDRLAEGRKKTGVFSGLYCINSLNGYRMPLYVADYVLGNVGTGAVVGVPGHDKRDFEFAQVFNISVVRVVQKDEKDTGPITVIDQVQENEGIMVNSDFLNGLDIHEATQKIMDHMEEKGTGKRVVNYRIRDWSISRQRYWGAPIPMIRCDKCGAQPVPEKDLPVLLPDLEDYRPQGIPPLVSSEEFLNTTCPNCKGAAKREPETMDTFVDSSWYFLRYTDPHNDKEIFDKKKAEIWMPVKLYVIGGEHSILHLLYARFINKFLFDEGYLKHKEPFLKLRHLGLIQGDDGQKMSKSRGNVVNPDEVVEKFGADTLRVYEMFMGPFEDGQPWSTKGVLGAARFLEKVWALSRHFVPQPPAAGEGGKFSLEGGGENRTAMSKPLHRLSKKISEDIPAFKFNTAIAAFMEFLNKNKSMSQPDWEIFLRLLAPFAPHITEELWEKLGHQTSIHLEPWPKYDEELVKESQVNVVVQVSGKLRGTFSVRAGTVQAEVKQKALAEPRVKKYLEGKEIIKEIFVPDKLINFVVK